MATTATVLIPTFDHGRLIAFPVRSILAQGIKDLEIFIVGDGMPSRAEKEVTAISKMDKRIRLFKFPKHPRLGEDYRHELIKNKAKGKYIFYCADDDFWFPTHIQELLVKLKTHDFAHSMHTAISPDGKITVLPTDLSLPDHRKRIQTSPTFGVGLPWVAHSRKFYLDNLKGWRKTPKGIHTDLYMWRQFAAHKKCRIGVIYKSTGLHFASPERKGWSTAKREKELRKWFSVVQNQEELAKLKEKISDHVISTWIKTDTSLIKYIDNFNWARARLTVLETSIPWRVRENILKILGHDSLLYKLAKALFRPFAG